MELPSPGLHGNDGAEGCSVTKDFLHRVVGNWLSLTETRKQGVRDESVFNYCKCFYLYVCLLFFLISLFFSVLLGPVSETDK